MYDPGQMPLPLLHRFEHTIKVNALNIEAQQAIVLAQVFASCGSSYTMEVFDRIIGSQIDDLPIQQVFSAMIAFSSSKSVIRPKIQNLLVKTLADNLELLVPSQLITLSAMMLKSVEIGTKASEVDQRGSESIKALDLDRFLLNQLGALD